MKSSFRKAGSPVLPAIAYPRLRTSALPLLLSASALAGCATAQKPPEISYDNVAPAVLAVDPPAPIRVVELPKVLPLPGQLKPVEASKLPPESSDPAARVNQANAAARV
jgi:type IV secretion system protein TrbG